MAHVQTEKPIRNLVVISDTHAGSKLALFPAGGLSLGDGDFYVPSVPVQKLWSYWEQFWGEFVPGATRGEPYCVVHNGDAVEGKPHKSEEGIDDKRSVQRAIAKEILRPVVQACEGRYYHVRGTEAHVDKSGDAEEDLAAELGAVPDIYGNHSRYELWKSVGDKYFGHFAHHIGTTGTAAYESSAVLKEITEFYVESSKWRERAPDFVVRSHRHRYIAVDIPTSNTHAFSAVTPGWQLKTPFVFKIPGGRIAQPQFGGLVIRQGRHGGLNWLPFVKTVERGAVE